MRVNELEINEFRGIRSQKLDFRGPQTTVLVGANGAGKSSVLDCLAILLSRFIWRIRRSQGTGRYFTDYDINNLADETYNRVSISFQDHEIEWLVSKTRRGAKRQTMTSQEQIKQLAEEIWSRLSEKLDYNLPLAVYYPVNRAVIDIPLRIRKKHPFDQLAAYDLALSGGRNDFRVFFEWFRNREDLENELRIRNRSHRDPQLEAVRKAVSMLLPGFSDLRIERSPLRMTVTKARQHLIVNQLSDGEKCLLAMVGDLARRLAMANPGLSDALRGYAVVMIDEVDLHLHAAWQRRVIPSLKETFPNCQFILTTHSPQVLSQVKAEEIYILEDTSEGIVATRPSINSYGRDSNQILENILGVAERPESIKSQLQKYFRLIDEGKLEEARGLRTKLEKQIGTDEPQFAKADVLIRRKEILER
jgi:predicted ATP-binding protein involved in virulence